MIHVHLCSNAKAGAWTAEEIDKLITAMEKIPYGKWSRVQSEHHFHHRSQVLHPCTSTCPDVSVGHA